MEDNSDKRLMDKAGQLAESGNYPDAIELLRLYTERDKSEPSFSRCCEMIAQCYLEIDKPVDAYDSALLSTVADPVWSPGFITLARSARNSGLVKESISAFRRTQELNPTTEVSEELQEVIGLRRKEIATLVGMPALQLDEGYGEGCGPGGIVWDSGIYLASYLRSSSLPLKGMSILEIGSGTGLVGITCAMRGSKVTATDREDILKLLESNIHLNEEIIRESGGCCVCEVLDWDKPREDVLEKRWNLVIGADLVYSQRQISPLMSTLRLLHQSARILIAHKCRSSVVDAALFAELNSIGVDLHKQSKDNIKILSRGLKKFFISRKQQFQS